VRVFFIVLFIAITVASKSQTVSIQGKVINLRNEPIAGATIKVEELNKQFSANVEGIFRVALEKGKKIQFIGVLHRI